MAKLWVSTAAFLLLIVSGSMLHAQAPRVVTSLDSLDLPFGTNLQPLFAAAVRRLTKEAKPKSCKCTVHAEIDTSGRLYDLKIDTDCVDLSTNEYLNFKEQAISLAPRWQQRPVSVQLVMSVSFDSAGKAFMSLPLRAELASFSPARPLNIDSVKRAMGFPPALRDLLAQKKYQVPNKSIYRIRMLIWLKISKTGKVIDYFIDKNSHQELAKYIELDYIKVMRFDPASFDSKVTECWFPWPVIYTVGNFSDVIQLTTPRE